MAHGFEMVALSSFEDHPDYKFCARCDEWLRFHNGACLLTYADGKEPICEECADQLNAIVQDFMAIDSSRAKKASSKVRSDDQAASLMFAIENAIIAKNQAVTK